MKYAYGIDLGGTNVRIAIIDENGKIIEVYKESTDHSDNLNGIVKQIKKLYLKMKSYDYKIEGVGLGIPGSVTEDGMVLNLPNIGVYDAFDLKKLLSDTIKEPIYIGNDANVAGLGEALVGAGKGKDVVQYITLSTGIGGGLVINKKMIAGKHGYAQEIGGMIVRPNSKYSCPCKHNGCIEAEASGTALVKKAKELGFNLNHAGEVFSSNIKELVDLKNDTISILSSFIYNLIMMVEPEAVVIGGGLMKSEKYFFNDLKEKIKELLPDSLKDNVLITKAKYDQDCGIIGAAMQALL